MDPLMQAIGFLVAVVAAAGIVAGIETLNERCPHAPSGRPERIARTLNRRRDSGPDGPGELRRTRS